MTKRLGLAGIFMVALISLAGVAYAKIVSGTNGADNLTGTAEAGQNDELYGGRRTDTVDGGTGNDTLRGGPGDDMHAADGQDDDIYRGPGDGRVFYDHDGDFANVDNCEQIIPGG